jgi:hypothetical protein
MRCKKCGQRYWLEDHGMGSSDPPGCFFWITVVCSAIAYCGCQLGRGTSVGAVMVVLFGAAAFFAVWGIPLGIDDKRTYGGPNCPKCGHRVDRLWPWSL